MYEELIKKLRNRRVCVQSGGDLETDFPLMQEAADAIERLSTYSGFYEELTGKGIKTIRELLDKFPKWIPVNEMLPEFDQVVLVSDGHDVDTGWAVQFTERGGEKKVIWASPFADFDDVDSITHWMPLPEPPKEET